MKKAGVLLAIASLESDYGVGDFGYSAYKFVDLISKNLLKVWQILPLNPLGFGNSPYQPYSSFAIDEIYASLEMLLEDGLINDIKAYKLPRSNKIDYLGSRKNKEEALEVSYKNYLKGDIKEFEDFKNNTKWLDSYACFKAIKKVHGGACFTEWPSEYQNYHELKSLAEYHESIDFEKFKQFILNKQWHKLKKYANLKGIKIMGDIPIYVGLDSSDVWANKENFLLDEHFEPQFVAGVPPDYFSQDGQLWGNPIYDFEYLANHNFEFLIERLERCNELYDITRIDHFRAFDTYYKIPSGKTAKDGSWCLGPGKDFFVEVKKQLPKMEIVVEDLGDLRQEVYDLRDEFDLAGMKIIQFTYDPSHKNDYFKDKENLICYTGTHDNETIVGWYHNLSKLDQKRCLSDLKKYTKSHKINEIFISLLFSDLANLVIVPVQDILGLDNRTRINTPSTVGSPNWEFKLMNFTKLEKDLAYIKNEIIKNNRI